MSAFFINWYLVKPKNMPHIDTKNDLPGILTLLFYKAPTGRALSKLANTILHGPSPLSKGDRELIASYVSHLNGCDFCHDSHSASANYHFNGDSKKRLVTISREYE